MKECDNFELSFDLSNSNYIYSEIKSSTHNETFDSNRLQIYQQLNVNNLKSVPFNIRNSSTDSIEVIRNNSNHIWKKTKIPMIKNIQYSNKNSSNSKINNVSTSLMMLSDDKLSPSPSLESSILSKINENDFFNKTSNDHTLKVSNKKFLIHSETFSKVNPYLNQTCFDKLQLINNYPEVFLKYPNYKEKIIKMLYTSTNETVKPLNSDKIIDTSDLTYFIQQNTSKDLETNPSPNLDYKTDFNYTNENFSDSDNRHQDSENIDSSLLPSVMNKIISPFNEKNKKVDDNCIKCANDICEMLNNLLKDLENNKTDSSNHILKSSISRQFDGLKNDFNGNKSDNLQIYEDLPKTYTKLCCKTLDDISTSLSKSYESINQLDIDRIGNQINSHLKRVLNVDNSISEENESLKNKVHSNIRIFTVDQFDDLIKSHLSPVDRRIRAISKKSDCNIKILGPFNIFHNKLLTSNRCKTMYYCHLISDSKEKGDKCLKCLQDSFPSMRLQEINLTSSIYKH